MMLAMNRSQPIQARILAGGPRLLLLAVLALSTVWLLWGHSIPQLPHYHEFAQQGTLWGIPHAADVLSNLGFAVTAIWGWLVLYPKRACPELARAWPAHCTLLLALLCIALGSAYYHLAPDDQRLVWDRLPISLACSALLAGVAADTGRTSSVYRDLTLGSLFAIFGVVWWALTQDLRFYLLLQVLTVVLIPYWQIRSRAARADRVAYAAAAVCYGLAKLGECYDHPILALTGIISGHTLKHVLASGACLIIVIRLYQRTR